MGSEEVKTDPQFPIVLFDGVCNLCNGSVQFIIKRDPKKQFRFASLQSPAGQALLDRFGLEAAKLDSVVLVEGDRCHVKSSAALQIAGRLGGGWPLLAGLRVIPRFLRDAVYDMIARRRYRWFGKAEACLIPSPALKERFLE